MTMRANDVVETRNDQMQELGSGGETRNLAWIELQEEHSGDAFHRRARDNKGSRVFCGRCGNRYALRWPLIHALMLWLLLALLCQGRCDAFSSSSSVSFRAKKAALTVRTSTATYSLLARPVVQKKKQSNSSSIALVDISWLKAHEQTVSSHAVKSLHDHLLQNQAYTMPLLVDARSGAILDGHHRHAVGLLMNLRRLPAVLVDYLHDDTIRLDVWPDSHLRELTKQDVIDMSLSDEVFPPKTSKHDFVKRGDNRRREEAHHGMVSPIHVPLEHLR